MSDHPHHLLGTTEAGRPGAIAGCAGPEGPGRPGRSGGIESAQTPESVAHLLDVVAEHNADRALGELGRMVVQLQADAAQAGEARQVLRTTSARVLREALRLRAARAEATR